MGRYTANEFYKTYAGSIGAPAEEPEKSLQSNRQQTLQLIYLLVVTVRRQLLADC
jgi:hypothetical protein